MRTGFTKGSAIASFAFLSTLLAGVPPIQAAPSLQSHRSLAASTLDRSVALNANSMLASVPWGVSAPTGGIAAPSQGSGSKAVYQAKIKRRLNGIPVIDVVFNRSRKFEMIVDTGASGTLITQQMANALRLKIIGSIRSGIADGSVVEFPIGRVNSISVDGAEVRNVEVAIAEQMDIGLLGHDFFGNYDMKIKRDVVEFYRR